MFLYQVQSTTSICTILVLTANNDMVIHQMDIEKEFFNAILEEDMYDVSTKCCQSEAWYYKLLLL